MPDEQERTEKRPGVVVGIDLGIAILRGDVGLELHTMPTLSTGSISKREYDITALKTLLEAEQPIELAAVRRGRHADKRRHRCPRDGDADG
jgi:hypothetical protein